MPRGARPSARRRPRSAGLPTRPARSQQPGLRQERHGCVEGGLAAAAADGTADGVAVRRPVERRVDDRLWRPGGQRQRRSTRPARDPPRRQECLAPPEVRQRRVALALEASLRDPLGLAVPDEGQDRIEALGDDRGPGLARRGFDDPSSPGAPAPAASPPRRSTERPSRMTQRSITPSSARIAASSCGLTSSSTVRTISASAGARCCEVHRVDVHVGRDDELPEAPDRARPVPVAA